MLTASGGILILLNKSCNDKEIKESKFTDRRICDYIAPITVNAVVEDFRRPYLVRTKRNQKTDQECKKQVDENFKFFVNNFQSHWKKRRNNIEQLMEDYVSAC